MNTYKYTFNDGVPMEQVDEALTLALLSVESLRGAGSLRLDARYALDRNDRSCTIAADSGTGEQLNLVFVGLVRREFGDGAFSVARVDTAEPGARDVAAPTPPEGVVINA